MKKLIVLFSLLFMVAATFAQVTTYRIANGSKDVDSLTGTAAGATVGTKYYYFNTLGTVAGGLTYSATPIQNSEILAVQVWLVAPTKAADMMDSTRVTIEGCYGDPSVATSWFQIGDAGQTTDATARMTRNGLPKAIGTVVANAVTTGATYEPTTVKALVVKNVASGGTWYFDGLIVPYLRVKTMSYDDATGAFYPKIYVALKKL